MELLPDTQTPSWLGLPNNAERVLLTTQGEFPSPQAAHPCAPAESCSSGWAGQAVSVQVRGSVHIQKSFHLVV